MKNPPELAIWDIDGTLAHPSLERQFVSYLLDQKILSRGALVGRAFGLALRARMVEWHRIKLAYVMGSSQASVAEWVEAWWAHRGRNGLLPGAVATVRQLQMAGTRQLLLSGTADFLAARLARHLELSDVVAGRAEVQDGCYSGALQSPHPRGPLKSALASEWLSLHGIHWNNTLALADHEDDLPLLSSAARAVAVNPGPALKKEAIRREWLCVKDAELPHKLLEWL